VLSLTLFGCSSDEDNLDPDDPGNNDNSQYVINDVFSNRNETSYLAKDIYAIWWDKDTDRTNEANALLDEMILLKEVILSEYCLQVPQNTLDGYFINIYLHADGGFYDSKGWGNGMRTDSNGYPFLTLPHWILSDKLNTAHETFHLFQHNSNASGFWYEGDKQWYTEATANWFAYLQNPSASRSFVTSEILARLPHVPLWSGWFNRPDSYPQNWQRENHQYALGQFLYYLTEEADIARCQLTEGYYSNTTLNPQEYLYNNLGSINLRNHFLDWATLVVNEFDFPFMSQNQKNTVVQEWNTYAEPNDDNQYIEIFNSIQTNSYRPSETKVTTAWSFNTYKLINSSNGNYTFNLNGDDLGSYGAESFFTGKVIVKNQNGNTTIYDLEMTNNYQGSLSLNIENTDTEVFFIIASMPEIFEDNNQEYQTFSYEIRID
jgi:hypothetical protein